MSDSLAGLRDQISDALAAVGVSGVVGADRTTGAASHGEVSDLATAAVAAAASSVSALVGDMIGERPTVNVDRSLVDQWCRRGFEPVGWEVPDVWDPFARDYRTSDGRVRFHTNAPHHRAAALGVLGDVSTVDAATEAASRWRSAELESAVYAAGGCAVELRTGEQWLLHEQGRAVAGEPVVAWSVDSDSGIQPHHMKPWVGDISSRPLAGLRVLDLTRVIAGPVSTRFLAGFGADVVRIDPPEWSEGVLEVDMTVGKTCAGLNLRLERDRAVFTRLVGEAHVLVHGYRADVLERLGFGPAVLRTLNPNLILVGLNAFGWSGPWRNRRGFDSLVQRSSGLAVEIDDHVVAMPYQILDHATGYLTAASAVQALRARLAGVAIRSARLSLARQAHMLLELGATAALVPQLEPGSGDNRELTRHAKIESTPLGPVKRYPLPFTIDGVTFEWSSPASGLRSGRPAFRA